MIVKLLSEHHLELLSLKGGCRGSSESTLVKMSNCWKSHALAQIERNKLICYYQSVLTFVLGAQKNRLIETTQHMFFF